MPFQKYPHIERLGNDEVDGILVGICHVFPKIDGTNASVWIEDGGVLCAGSRRRQLTLEDDNAGFLKWLYSSDMGISICGFLAGLPAFHLYGEWLVPHTMKTYRQDAWRRFYVFDVYSHASEMFVPYDEYAPILDNCGIDYIPVLEICKNPSEEHLVSLLTANTFLIEDGKGPGEGLVIKRYGYKNEYDRTTWAKIVRNKFKESNQKAFGPREANMLGGIEIELAEEYVTEGRVHKVFAKMVEGMPWASRRIPELFNRVWHDIIDDEMWNILKKHKNPKINFKRFYSAVVQRVKSARSDLF